MSMTTERKQELLAHCEMMPEPKFEVGETVWTISQSGIGPRISKITEVVWFGGSAKRWAYFVEGGKNGFFGDFVFRSKEELIAYLEA